MNNKVNYTLIGTFTLAGLLLLMGFAYWLLRPSGQEDTQKYLIYFNESVLGLNIDAPVKYRGIAVGKVSAMRIDPHNSEQVEVTVDVLSTTPIKVTTLARLTAQGITGLTYINLSMGENESPLLEAEPSQKYPVIKTEPSFFENIEKSLGDVSLQLSKTLTKTEDLLKEENQEQITQILQKTANILEKIDGALDEKSIKHFQNTLANMDATSQKLHSLMPKVEQFIAKSVQWEESVSGSLASIMQSYLGIQDAMGEIKRAVSSGEFNIEEITADIIPTLNNTFLEMQHLLFKVEDVLKHHERSPSDIFYKQERSQKGPGEE